MLKMKPISYSWIKFCVGFLQVNQAPGIVAIGDFASLDLCKAELSGVSHMAFNLSLSNRSFLITYLALLQTRAWRRPCCTPFPLESCCRLPLECNEDPECSHGQDSDPAASCLEPCFALRGVKSITQALWKQFVSTQNHLTFWRHTGWPRCFIWKSFLS